MGEALQDADESVLSVFERHEATHLPFNCKLNKLLSFQSNARPAARAYMKNVAGKLLAVFLQCPQKRTKTHSSILAGLSGKNLAIKV